MMDDIVRRQLLSKINPAWHNVDDDGVVIISDGLTLALSILQTQPEHPLASKFLWTYGNIQTLSLQELSQQKIARVAYGAEEKKLSYCVDFEYEHPRFQKTVFDHVIVRECKDANEAEWTIREYISGQFEWSIVSVHIHRISTEMPGYSVKVIPSLSESEKAQIEIETRNGL